MKTIPTNGSKTKPNSTPIWTTSVYTKEDLDGKTVEFRFKKTEGVGCFRVRRNPAGLLAIRIVVQGRPTPDLPQEAVSRIQRNPDQSIAAVRLF